MSGPKINVTPLIDVLLVLLIVFMVIAPLKPSSFRARIPRDSPTSDPPDPRTLIVTLDPDRSLGLNGQRNLGTADEPEALVSLLRSIFLQREQNRSVDESGNVAKAVFIKAPRKIDYGSVTKVIDAV